MKLIFIYANAPAKPAKLAKRVSSGLRQGISETRPANNANKLVYVKLAKKCYFQFWYYVWSGMRSSCHGL